MPSVLVICSCNLADYKDRLCWQLQHAALDILAGEQPDYLRSMPTACLEEDGDTVAIINKASQSKPSKWFQRQ